jgi:hypothetical protein
MKNIQKRSVIPIWIVGTAIFSSQYRSSSNADAFRANRRKTNLIAEPPNTLAAFLERFRLPAVPAEGRELARTQLLLHLG